MLQTTGCTDQGEQEQDRLKFPNHSIWMARLNLDPNSFLPQHPNTTPTGERAFNSETPGKMPQLATSPLGKYKRRERQNKPREPFCFMTLRDNFHSWSQACSVASLNPLWKAFRSPTSAFQCSTNPGNCWLWVLESTWTSWKSPRKWPGIKAQNHLALRAPALICHWLRWPTLGSTLFWLEMTWSYDRVLVLPSTGGQTQRTSAGAVL